MTISKLVRSAAAMGVVFYATMAAAHATAQTPAVTVTAQEGVYVLDNGYVRAEVDRRTGDLRSLKHKGQELMGFKSGHHAGYWEQNPSGAAELTDGLSIDPATNGGERAEVYIRGKANGKSLLRGGQGNGMVVDMEIRYALGRDDHGVYTYAIFSHPANYPATGIGESRFGMKLNGDLFDWLSIDKRHNQAMPTGYDWDHGAPLNMKEARRLTTGTMAGKVEHKYDYTADQFDWPAQGWSSTKQHVGIFLVNPSPEFLSGGPTKYELDGHLDDGEGGDPTILDYWRSTHYGGSSLDLASGEAWSKVVGPILVYVNEGPTPDDIFRDALAQAGKQAAQWPFAWVKAAEYAPEAERATVSGRLIVDDPQMASGSLGRMWVGMVPRGAQDGAWQRDAKDYQFWVNADKSGSFKIPHVRQGTYVLTALADGVFGEFDGPEVTVAPGKAIDLKDVTWKPKRYGAQVWDIGIPNRNASEFDMGDHYDHWGMYFMYAKLFPNDVQYTIGKSDYRKDWYFEQVPNVAHGDGVNGPDTTWTVQFDLDSVKGPAILRTGLCGVSARHVFVTVNGKDAGDLAPLVYNATINRDGIQGDWTEHDVRVPANLLKKGTNVLGLRVPGGNAMSGVMYDYLRLEWDESGGKAK